MEMLYRIKLDYESKGEASELATLFSRACRELEDNVGYSSRSHHRLRLLDEQISELRTVLGCDELSPGECYPACPGEDGVPFAAMSLQNSQPQVANADSTAIPKEHGGRSLLQGVSRESLTERLFELKVERETLDSVCGAVAQAFRGYRFFLECLERLPDKNPAGMKLNILGIDGVGDKASCRTPSQGQDPKASALTPAGQSSIPLWLWVSS